jgi:hypothetical protein
MFVLSYKTWENITVYIQIHTFIYSCMYSIGMNKITEIIMRSTETELTDEEIKEIGEEAKRIVKNPLD